jgi:hypothetical protein
MGMLQTKRMVSRQMNVIPTPSAYLVSDDLEYTSNGAATAAGWSIGATSPTFGYNTSPAPLQGSYSLMENASADVADISFDAQDEVWAYFLVNVPTTDSTVRCAFKDNTDTTIATINFITTGIVRVNAGGGTDNSSSAGVISANTTYHVWVRYVKGTGANAIMTAYVSTNGVKGAAVASRTAGTSTTQATKFRFNISTSNTVVFDKLRISTTEIPDNPT